MYCFIRNILRNNFKMNRSSSFNQIKFHTIWLLKLLCIWIDVCSSEKKAYTYEYLIILTEISHEEDRSMKWRCASFFVFIELDKYLGQIVVTINGLPEWWQIWDPYYGHDFFFFFSLSKRLVWHSISFVRFFMYFRGILIVKWWTQCSFFFIFFLVFDYSQNIQQ